jgi:hypothetical protein
MAKKGQHHKRHSAGHVKRGKGRHPSPTPKARKAYYHLIEKSAERTMGTLAKHNPAAAERIAHKVV